MWVSPGIGVEGRSAHFRNKEEDVGGGANEDTSEHCESEVRSRARHDGGEDVPKYVCAPMLVRATGIIRTTALMKRKVGIVCMGEEKTTLTRYTPIATSAKRVERSVVARACPLDDAGEETHEAETHGQSLESHCEDLRDQSEGYGVVLRRKPR
jgi:hypothetical protein